MHIPPKSFLNPRDYRACRWGLKEILKESVSDGRKLEGIQQGLRGDIEGIQNSWNNILNEFRKWIWKGPGRSLERIQKGLKRYLEEFRFDYKAPTST